MLKIHDLHTHPHKKKYIYIDIYFFLFVDVERCGNQAAFVFYTKNIWKYEKNVVSLQIIHIVDDQHAWAR